MSWSAAGPPLLLPLVVNFGHGVGNAWRIQGEEVAVFGRSALVSAAGKFGVGRIGEIVFLFLVLVLLWLT